MKIKQNNNLLPKIVYCIQKTITEDLPNHLVEHRNETNNAIKFLRGDFINNNLRNFVAQNDIILIPFIRASYDGRIIADKQAKITYSIVNIRTLAAARKKKNNSPHYLQSVLFSENNDLDAEDVQLTLFENTQFGNDVLQLDYENIIKGLIDPNENYQHYVISYDRNKNELTDVQLILYDQSFNEVESISLNNFIAPDFAQLTAQEDTSSSVSTSHTQTKELVKLKKGVKPKLREIEKKA